MNRTEAAEVLGRYAYGLAVGTPLLDPTDPDRETADRHIADAIGRASAPAQRGTVEHRATEVGPAPSRVRAVFLRIVAERRDYWLRPV